MLKTAVAPPPFNVHRTVLRQWAILLLFLQRMLASRLFAYAVFSLGYLEETLRMAQRKLFWDDEFFTLFLSRIPSWHGLLTALSTGADQHPPSFYALTHWIMLLFGTRPITVRLPAIVGFWVLCVCLYEIVRYLLEPGWGVVALLFPLTTNFYYYATEARGYGLEVGFVALALLSWLKAASGSRRQLFLPLLALGVAGAVCMHYYAAVVMVCLGLGEIVRFRQFRRLDVPVWLALACGLLPLIAFHQTIGKARGYSGHFWAVPVWSDAFAYYRLEMTAGFLVFLACGILALLATARKWHSRGATDPVVAGRSLPLWQAVGICCLAASPLLVMVGAKYVTHGFADRYAIAGLVGVTVLLCCVLHAAAPQSYAAPAMVGICVLLMIAEMRDLNSRVDLDRKYTGQTIQLLRAMPDLPIDLTEAGTFYRVSFYAPRELASRVQYVADPAASVRYLNQDTLDRGLLDLRPWFPLKALTLSDFQSQNKDFIAYGQSSTWDWFTYELPKFGEARLLMRNGQALLFAVKRPQVDVPRAIDHETVPMLFDSVPTTGASLCETYLGGGCY